MGVCKDKSSTCKTECQLSAFTSGLFLLRLLVMVQVGCISKRLLTSMDYRYHETDLTVRIRGRPPLGEGVPSRFVLCFGHASFGIINRYFSEHQKMSSRQ